MGTFIDFNFIKSNTDVVAVLDALGIEHKKRAGSEVRIHCIQPDHADNRASCDVNTENKAFYCHSCHAQGSILDLVATHQGCDLREASQQIADICDITISSRSHPQAREKKHQSSKAGKNRQIPSPNSEPGTTSNQEEKTEFKPFTTILKLDTEHSFGIERGFTPALIEEFAMGFQDRGMFKNRWCVPIHDIAGNQLGYTGRYAAKRLPKDVEKWMLPKNFPKQEILFNAHRFVQTDNAGVVLVEGPFDVARLHTLKIPVLGLLGTSISDAQINILLEELDIEYVITMLDGDAPGRKATPDLIAKLSHEFFVRDIKLPDGEDPETVAEDFLQEELWGVV